MDEFRSEVIPDSPPEEEQNRAGKLRRALVDVLETLLISLLLYFGINAVSARIRVESISMLPTLESGNYVIVNKLAYRFGKPSRGDIVVFRYPPDPKREPYIKRVIGLPGDVVRVSGGVVYVNEQPLSEPYISAPPDYEGIWTVPEDSLFVLGDNRNRSSDSHSWGMVPLKNVIGKAWIVYWPPQDWKILDYHIAVAAEN
ncbi:MAG: signal peptidase I [Anaerolineales bacterium]|nr:signal peptidase I [Anaerolineales bacterium]MCS7246887.1 signal peptidase I [Anaerolineales bacterium]MDW8160698.1 signal peptidase I [Anaerolineales bacterium]MDW8448170.1 signal peptidase I [Anaerolineales bacterium]